MGKKIFFTDLDETLLTSDKKISPATEEVLKKLVAAGHYLVLSSGRATVSIMEVRKTLPISDHNLFFSAYNGSEIVDASTGKTIREERVALEDVAYFTSFCDKEGIVNQSYQDGCIIIRKNCPELEDYRKVIHMPYKEVPDVAEYLTEAPFKCLALTLKGGQVLDDLENKLKPWAEGRLSLVKSSEKLLELIPANSGKGSAVRFLANYLNIPIEDTLAAGDQENDISMIQAAGVGVAMCNGVESVKSVADIVTKTDNNHDGLVPILSDFFQL